MLYAVTVTNFKNESLRMELAHPEDSGMCIYEITGIGGATASINTVDMATIDGARFTSARVESRNIVLSIKIGRDPSVEYNRHKMHQFFPIKKPLTLKFEIDDGERWIDGYVESNDAGIFSNNESVQISIICPSPFFYEASQDTDAFSGVIPMFEFPFWDDSISLPSDADKYNTNLLPNWNFESPENSSGRKEWHSYGPTINGWSVSGGSGSGNYSVTLEEGSMQFRVYSSNQYPFEWSASAPVTRNEQYCLSVLATDDEPRSVSFTVPGEGSFASEPIPLANGFDFIARMDAISSDLTVALEKPIPEDQPGRNLYIKKTAIDGYIEPTTGEISEGSAEKASAFIGVQPSTSYQLQWWGTPEEVDTNDIWVSWAFYDYGMVYISGDVHAEDEKSGSEAHATISLTTPENTFYIRVSARMYSDGKLKFEQGDTPTAYSEAPEDSESQDSYVINLRGAKLESGTESTLAKNEDGAWVLKLAPSDVDINPGTIEFGAIRIDDRAIIEYSGDSDTGILITIHCNDVAEDIVVYNIDTGDRMTIKTAYIQSLTGGSIGKGDDIVINTERGKRSMRLLRNGVYTNIIGALDKNSGWLMLTPGTNIFAFGAASGANSLQVNFSYRKTYGGI